MSVDATSGDAPDAHAGNPVLGAVADADAVAVTNDARAALPPAPETPGPPSAPEEASLTEADLGWKDSSLELLTGVEVTDFSESISGETFHALFRP